MLLGNYSVLTRNAGRFLGGVTHSTYRPTFNTAASNRNRFFSVATWDAKAAQPNGNLHPRAWVLPQVSGGMSSYTYVSGIGLLSGSGAMGRNATATLIGTGDLAAIGALIVSLAATIPGTGTISTANLIGIVSAVADLVGSGAITTADLKAKAELIAALAGTGTLTNTVNAIGTLSATINIGASDPLSPQALAAAVWNALATEFNDTGSFGELVIVDYDRILREVRDSLVPHIWSAS